MSEHAQRRPDRPDRRVGDPLWTPILDGLRAPALDCLQTSFALLADHAYGGGRHLALGSRFAFHSRVDNDLLGVEATPDDRATEAEDLLGLRVEGRWRQLDGPRVRRLIEPGRPLYLTADAYHLSWCPYQGHEHMRHSFLAVAADTGRGRGGGGVTVVDAYHNDTAWGPARPGVWRLPAAEFDAALAGGAHALAVAAGPPPAIDVPAAVAGNAGRARAARPQIDRYLSTVHSQLSTVDGLRRLVLDVWLLGRARQLHEHWLAAARPGAAAAMTGQAERWQQLAARSYVALRRGRATPGLADALAALLAEHLATLESAAATLESAGPSRTGPSRSGPRDEPVRAAVVGALCETLHVDQSRLRAADTLRDLPGFNSFRLVDVIDRVERRLGVEVPAAALSAADLHDVDSLCAMFASAAPAGGGR
jgi:acyl carrier protein